MSKVVERFLNYIKVNTTSNENSSTTPSTENQLKFAKYLVKELLNIGIKNVYLTEKGYVIAKIPSNTSKNIPNIGFIAHMDTSADALGENINPKIIKEYDGKDIILNKEKNIILSPEEFPELKNYIGEDIITTDGTTLLGADDKAGIAEIVTAMEYIINNPEIKHGNICIGFTPDEEIGRGSDYFDIDDFGADFSYTIDGGKIGELQYENFNAASAKLVIHGKNVHPGSAKNKMINSIMVANEFLNMLPKAEQPEYTENREGFFHLTYFNGNVENTELHFIIRDFNKSNFKYKKQLFENITKFINDKYRKNIAYIEIHDQYYNMKEKILPLQHIIDIAYKAIEESHITPLVNPIRGGTDGARLSFLGMPTPNLFTGGENFHGRYEYIPINSMEKAVEVILKIIDISLKTF
ncbi:peptidase T [Clostridium acetireducens DSM 10703]|jgi:tripeptide aminopeptidase|uniref:Peptidase T n=1 Tax=Clostridium acetireducens DSM 10703 TaxID=1121290 RepID=A0A1E8F263_9CLOT|nr:peptidase T [Clostridium acetireducens]OFI07421.1 peptidase T [Clostridium acetireducens DSM 10703]